MKRFLIAASAASAALLAPLACDLQQISADKLMVGTLLSTPEVKVSPGAAAGLDGGFPSADGGEATVTIPAQTAALVFFGTRSGDNSTPEPISGATVNLQPSGGQAVTLSGGSGGVYTREGSGNDSTLTYQPGATYDFVVNSGGEKFVGRVENAPAKEEIKELHPLNGYVSLAANSPFSFNRKTLGPGEERTVGFTTVVPVSSSGQKGDPTYSDMPTTPLEFLQLIAIPAQWKKDAVTVPATAFPDRDQTYLIVFQTVRTGGAESSNLWFGSALLAGTADVGVVHTQP